ncbi:MAG TPA: hypothetical protein PKM51_05415 [Chitinophagales bacterium]|nr:hypothetical protein [Chitinophagales bacterium]HNM32168.1 hypothetical protein [Chitinophagales bacterium]
MLVFSISLLSCSKEIEKKIDKSFTVYTIKEGEHFSDNNNLVWHDSISEMKFIVEFDNSAIYTTIDSLNQLDVNKLYGFSDNASLHHDFSARIGWRWRNNKLELLAYIYNNSVRDFTYIKSVPLNQEITCSIKIASNKYIFSVDDTTIEMPRTAVVASGYQLYPYFGGDETAPHSIKIYIKNL